MLQHCEHHDVIELGRLQGQGCAYVRAHSLPSSSAAISHLVVHAYAVRDSVGRIIQECRVEAAAQIANACSLAELRVGGTKPHARTEVIQTGVGHYFKS